MNLKWAGILLAVLLEGCASAGGVRFIADGRRIPELPSASVSLVPSAPWPLRQGTQARTFSDFSAKADWTLPHSVAASVAVSPAQPLAPAVLPLPELRPLPVKATPRSRSWTPVTQSKGPAPLPVPSTAALPKKPAATVPAVSQPAVPPKAAEPRTAAASASLLPMEPSASADFRWEDVNAAAGDAVTLHFDKTNWLYLDSPSQQKTLGFQSINRDKTATTFVFKPVVPGEYILEFQRQDLANQTVDTRKVRLTVVKPGTRTSSTGTVLAPQTSSLPANDALEASRALAASGKTAEAVQKLLESYRADDARINLELARLLSLSGQNDEALGYLDRNLTLTGPDFQSTLELGTKLAALKDPQKKLPAYVKLWAAGTSAPPEDLYVQVLETLRVQKLHPLTKDWSARYFLWYPAPKLRDRYLFQVGQWLEEPGEARDVRGAWKAYNEVVQSYPLSPYWKAAGERAAYLNRHFLQVR